jgi:CubicO group peptidase (beta-lactamase class C family)
MPKMAPTALPLLLSACLMASLTVKVHAQEFVNKPADLPFNAIQPKVAGFSEEGLRNIDRFWASEMAQKRVPGAVMGILRDGKLVYLKAHGVRDPALQAPMQIDSIFALASMTKPMAAVGALLALGQFLPKLLRTPGIYPQGIEVVTSVALLGFLAFQYNRRRNSI